jgi:hypothetical protein
MKRIGSPNLMIDAFHLFFILPLSTASILFNLITLILLQSKKVQNTSLNKLIKMYTLTSLAICVMIFMKALTSIPRYSSFSYSYWARIFICYISTFGTNSLIFFANMLNIVVLLERLSMFVIRFQKFHTKHPYEYSRLIFVISVLVNIIFYFQTETKSEDQFTRHRNNPKLLVKMERCDLTEFGKSIYARVGMIIAIFVDNFFSLIIEIIASFISIKYFQQFVKHREMLINLGHHKNKMWQFADTNQIVNELSIINHNPDQANQDLGQLIYELNTSITRFIISLTIISVFSNIISIIITVPYTIYYDVNGDVFSLAVLIFDLIYLIKHGSIFFFLILLDRNFRKYLFNC